MFIATPVFQNSLVSRADTPYPGLPSILQKDMIMEDSFRVRVDKIFGSLCEDNDAPWSLTDEEVKRRQWNRPPIQQINDEIELDIKNQCLADKSIDFEIESQIGRDLTLDFEEDENKYDKLAIGVEQTDGLYMKDLNHDDYGIEELNTYGELPTSFDEVSRDPRANHMAAKIRLREDDNASGNFNASPPLGDYVSANMETEDVKSDELNTDTQISNSILKKGENLAESKSGKHVIFMHDSKGNGLQLESSTLDGALDHVSDPFMCSSVVPDYIRNPSKYTCYTFDDSSDDIDDQSNKSAFLEFFESLRKRDVADSTSVDDAGFDISKPVVFNRKTKQEGTLSAKRTGCGYNKVGYDVNTKNWSIGVTMAKVEESEIDAMEEDDLPLTIDMNVKSQKPGRRYRAKITEMED